MRSLVLCSVMVLSFNLSSAMAADPVQERAVPNAPIMQSTIPTMPTQTTDQKLAALQQQVQALQAQVAALQSVLKVTGTGATLQAPTLSLISSTDIVMQSAKGFYVTAGQGIALQSQGGTSIKAGSTALVEAQGTLDLKGAMTKLNGGAKPIATVGGAVGNGKILTGSPTILGN